MSIKVEVLRNYIREMIKQELDEASVTGNIDGGEGPPKTPFAFSGKRKKDKKKEVGIIFLEKNETKNSSATFIQAQRELLSQGFPNPGLLEVGEYDGRNYMSMSLDD